MKCLAKKYYIRTINELSGHEGICLLQKKSKTGDSMNWYQALVKADHKKLSPPCNLCQAVCCQSSQRPFAVLLDKQDLERLPKAVPFAKKTTDGLVALPYIDGKCPFLSGTSCSVYDKRPELCREFNCVNGCQNGRLSFFLQDHPEVVKIIKQAYPDIECG